MQLLVRAPSPRLLRRWCAAPWLPRTVPRRRGLSGVASAKGALAGKLANWQVGRRNAAELLASESRFPFKDSFELDRTHTVDAETVIAAVSTFMTEERVERIGAVCQQRTFNVLPIMEGTYDMGNLAAVCRSADALGFGAVHCIRPPQSDRYKQSRRTSAGADKWLDVQVWDSTEACLLQARAAGFQVVCSSLQPGAVPISEVDWSRPTAFVLGNEKEGVSEEALSLSDAAVSIPMAGFVDSYNLSVAAALIMWEARRVRVERMG